MGRRALAVAILAVWAAGADAATPARRGTRAAPAARAGPARTSRPVVRPAGPARAPSLAEAKVAMATLMRDRERRRFRHQWERAIGNLVRAARGKDAAAGQLEAARARYALYRWSANEADREEALAHAARAAKLGSRDAPALARAIRREAGEERPQPTRSRKRAPAAALAASERRPPPAEAPPAPQEASDEDSPADPALEAAIAELTPAAAPALPLGSSGGEGRARISEVRTWASEEYTRVAVYLSHWVGWHKLELPSAPGRPRRIALDFRPALLEGAALARPVSGGQVDRVRAAQNDAETVRVVLELPRSEGVQLFALEDPPRLVVDVGTRGGGASAATTEAATSSSTATSSANEPPHPDPLPRLVPGERERTPIPPSPDSAEDSARPIRRIVVDAGHGGHDPGAIGPRRVREKDVTLAIARRLAKRLRAAGFEVVLTRKDDRFLALEERTAIANTARGDLFVSIHANAHPQRSRAGLETYFLNTADDRYAARLAARENGLDLGEGEGEVARILMDLDAKASAGASRSLARLVQREVTVGVRARVGDVRDLGVKSALFYVLLGARMPAVLVETAFISNRDEERRLASTRYQDEVAGGIARAVSTFARGPDRVAAAR